MAVIIRLQNLPLSANTLDIREFFKGLCIPEGGVHIVGGEFGDAFIGFATDEDARQAMNMTNQTIKESRVRLLLSSRNEMQNVILAARERQAKLFMAAASLNGDPTAAHSAPQKTNYNITSSKASDKGEQHGRDRSNRSKSRSRDRSDLPRDRHRLRSRSRSSDRKRLSNENSSYNPNARVDPRTVNKKASLSEKTTSDRDKVNYTTSGNQALYAASNDINNLNSSHQPFQNLKSTSLMTPSYNSNAALNSDIIGSSSNYPNNYNPLSNSSYTGNVFNPLVNSALYPPPLPFFMTQSLNLPLSASTMPSFNQSEYSVNLLNTTAKNVILSNPDFTIDSSSMLIDSYGTDQNSLTHKGGDDKRVNTFAKYFVQVGNIPVEFRFGDIEDFFSGCDLWQGQEGIVEILGPRLESTDKLILRLRSESGYQRALAKNGQRLSNFKNRVEIFPSSEGHWMAEKSRQNKAGELGMNPDIDTLPIDNYPNKSGEFHDLAYGRMNSIENPTANMWASGNDFRIKSSLITNINSPSCPPSRGFCIKMRNFAYEADSVDIQRFFKDLHILNLHIETNDNGKRTGMAYVEFATKRHLDAALEQHKMKILDRSVLIEEIPKSDVIEIVRLNVASFNKRNNKAPIDAYAPANSFNNYQNFPNKSNVCSGFFCVLVSNLPTSFSVKDIASMFTSHNINPKNIKILTDHGKMMGQAFVELHNIIDVNAVVARLNGLRIGSNNVVSVASALNLHEIKRHLRQYDPMDWPNDNNITGGNIQKSGACFRSSLLGKPTMPNYANGDGPSPAHVNNSRFGSNQRTIHKVNIKNLPDNVSADDIIDLFKPFHCIPHTLQIIHADGKPTGEATLGFPSPQASNRVLESMNGKSYKNRKLSLALLSH